MRCRTIANLANCINFNSELFFKQKLNIKKGKENIVDDTKQICSGAAREAVLHLFDSRYRKSGCKVQPLQIPGYTETIIF